MHIPPLQGHRVKGKGTAKRIPPHRLWCYGKMKVITNLESNVGEESFPTSSDKLPKTNVTSAIMLAWTQLSPPTTVKALKSLSFSFTTLHNHLPRRASLKIVKSVIPKPSVGKDWLTMFHFPVKLQIIRNRLLKGSFFELLLTCLPHYKEWEKLKESRLGC